MDFSQSGPAIHTHTNLYQVHPTAFAPAVAIFDPGYCDIGRGFGATPSLRKRFSQKVLYLTDSTIAPLENHRFPLTTVSWLLDTRKDDINIYIYIYILIFSCLQRTIKQ